MFLQQRRAIYQATSHVINDWRYCLSLDNENRCRESLKPNLKFYDMVTRSQTKEIQGLPQQKCASILVSLCSVKGQPSFLFTLRSMTLDTNKGDVSFAGGKFDQADRDVVDTALRETWEELGIHVAAESVWGVLKPLQHSTKLLVAPVLANLGPIEDLSFRINHEEVEEVFTLPFSHLCNPQNRGYTNFREGEKYRTTFPVFHNWKKRVWGMTAIAVNQTLKLVIPS